MSHGASHPIALTRNPFPELSSPDPVTSPTRCPDPVTSPTRCPDPITSPSRSYHIYLDTSARSTPSSSPPGGQHGFPDICSNHGNYCNHGNMPRSVSGCELPSQCYHGDVDSSTVALKSAYCSSQDLGGHDNNGCLLGNDLDFPLLHLDNCDNHDNRVLFYMNEDVSHSLTIDASTRACDVCHSLVEKNHARDDINWAVIEHNTVLKHERLVEDHEVIQTLQRQWSHPGHYRLSFRKDFRKFEVFRTPAKFIPLDMVEASQLRNHEVSDLIPAEERYNCVLQQHLFTTCKLPDIHGHGYLKDKRSWKKVFLILRSTGLYYTTKGSSSKDSKQLSSLADVNIYTVLNADKTLVCPLPHCICLKRPHVTDVKDMILLGMDEKSYQCWHTALRLVMCGPCIRDDYKAAVNSLEGAAMKANAMTSNTDAHTQRVAMDFSGDRGRVVEDPCEAMAAANEEARQWRKKIATRKVMTRESDCARPSFLPNTSHVCEQYTTGLGAGVHMIQPWFHSGITRQEAVNLVTKQGLVDGVFLVRESNSLQDVYVLSLAHNHKVKHCQIHKYKGDGLVYFSLDGGHTKFTDLTQLVEFYQLNAAGLPTCLSHYVTCLV